MAFLVPQFILLMIFSIGMVQGRILTLNMSSTDDLISDGIDHVENQPLMISSTCEHQYGFLPCADNTGGYVFQILVYHGIAIFGEMLIGRGSKVLFAITGVGKVGGILFRILMSSTPMIMMIVSGVLSSKETAQSTVSAGVGIYTGITVFSLTLQWAIYVILLYSSKKDLKENGTSIKTGEPNSKCFPAEKAILFFKDTGVKVDPETQYTAGIMLLSLIPHVVVQLDVIFNTPKRIATLIALIVSFLSLITYFRYQATNLKVQERSLAYTEVFTDKAPIWVQLPYGKQYLILIWTILMKKFDSDGDGCVTLDEIIDGFKRLKEETPQTSGTSKSVNILRERQPAYNSWSLILSIFWIILGISIMTFLGGPLMTNILQLSYAMNLPSFCVSFVMVPFATNARVALKAILPATTHKDETAYSLTFSEIYGGVVMNNLAGMTTLLAIVITKGLTFDFSAEVLTVLVVCGAIGSMAYWQNRYPVWTCILVFSLYPLSLALYYFVQLFLGRN